MAYIKYIYESTQTIHAWAQPRPSVTWSLEMGLCVDITAKPPDDRLGQNWALLCAVPLM